ncbi:hypothetical protein WICMUC_003606 [Wickerhamomyces mucosus]|uniref:Uncharacterized protein n=1 Tax=Wickerhamomyces mucosus TaxID=1378264 RepID=A0A9P8PL27_9ASCO|nr:hypothetical protein WICMUC_003606 [Wickerhamomyces mucosus]
MSQTFKTDNSTLSNSTLPVVSSYIAPQLGSEIPRIIIKLRNPTPNPTSIRREGLKILKVKGPAKVFTYVFKPSLRTLNDVTTDNTIGNFPEESSSCRYISARIRKPKVFKLKAPSKVNTYFISTTISK